MIELTSRWVFPRIILCASQMLSRHTENLCLSHLVNTVVNRPSQRCKDYALSFLYSLLIRKNFNGYFKRFKYIKSFSKSFTQIIFHYIAFSHDLVYLLKTIQCFSIVRFVENIVIAKFLIYFSE